MTDGSRSRTGCLTCRIRKKKCDEQRPICRACHSRQLTCYGYNTPYPSWCTNKATWEEVKTSAEAKNLRALAETRYTIQRKIGWKSAPESNLVGTSKHVPEQGDGPRQFREYFSPLYLASATPGIQPTSSLPNKAIIPNTWQIHHGTIWWDNKISNLERDPGSSLGRDTKLLMLFLDVIHPITYSFYHLKSSKDRNWLLNHVINDRALYCAALSVSACFAHSLTQQPRVNYIGLCPAVTSFQGTALRELQVQIDKFAAAEAEDISLVDFVCNGVRLLDVILQLINLEVFSMLQGSWETHYRAARQLVNHLQVYSSPSKTNKKDVRTGPKVSPIEFVLSTLPETDERARSLKFCLTSFIWVDVIATATFGLSQYEPMAFDYHSLLQTEKIKTQELMGCQSWIMETITEITRLEHWKVTRQDNSGSQGHTLDLQHQKELLRRAAEISNTLKSGIAILEEKKNSYGKSSPTTSTSTLAPAPTASPSPSSTLDKDITHISIIWAHAARIFLHQVLDLPTASNPNPSTTTTTAEKPPNQTQDLLNTILRNLETLPTRLTMRVHWPYTIAGCTSLNGNEAQHDRFRGVLRRTMAECQAPGVTWKGVLVMEECWRMRTSRKRVFASGGGGGGGESGAGDAGGGADLGVGADVGVGVKSVRWREAMEGMGARVLLA